MTRTRQDWPRLLIEAAGIVRSYDTGVTLRQLFYRLVAAGTLPNTTGAYKALSAYTAEARRAGTFPPLIDQTRQIERWPTWAGAGEARAWLSKVYRRDRTEGQPVSIYLGIEKRGIVEQLTAWFGDRGLPIVPFGGYAGQSFVDVVAQDTRRHDRPCVLLYAGDFDPSGEDIDRDFIARSDCWADVARVALTAEQVEAYQLPENPGKASDSRAGQFIARHGRLVQVELDALPPSDLRQLFEAAIAPHWDVSAYERVLDREADDRQQLEVRA